MVRKLSQKLINKLNPLLWIAYKKYLHSREFFDYDGLKIVIHQKVFHPGLLYSTKILYKEVAKLELSDKRVLELGAGSGMIAMNCARKGARVLATDINPHSIASITKSAAINRLDITTIQSDLFDSISEQIFDFIFINPPYYQGVPSNELEMAFYAGPNFDYFSKLFDQLSVYAGKTTQVWMILSDNCDLLSLKSIAKEFHFTLSVIKEVKLLLENNYIYSIQRDQFS